jgi:hypothetical protein
MHKKLQSMDIALAAQSDTSTLFFCGQHVTLEFHLDFPNMVWR